MNNRFIPLLILLLIPHFGYPKKSSWVRSVRDLLLPFLSDYNKRNWKKLIDDVEGTGDVDGVAGDAQWGENSSTNGSTNNESTSCTFADVAGGIPPEISGLVDLINETKKYREYGVTPPRGILLVGKPGTGKTLLARALAGHCGCGFFSMGASEFIEMYVGVGAQRVRELFGKAADYCNKHPHKKAIIFIDEIDALGNRSTMSAHDTESKRTLNELLSQMDGFSQNSSIIVLAATNNSHDLDPALKRAGRFDMIVEITLPDKAKREAILRHYAKKIAPSKTDSTISFEQLAQKSAGFNNADLKELVRLAGNEAALSNAPKISQQFFDAALEKIRNQKRY
jgi:ATP-dependent Zn protease